nr:MAG TPA: hypothetical protein [Caudoviricetes sp.]
MQFWTNFGRKRASIQETLNGIWKGCTSSSIGAYINLFHHHSRTYPKRATVHLQNHCHVVYHAEHLQFPFQFHIT